MTTLERTAALAFRDELLKIANAGALNSNEFEKSAAVQLFDAMQVTDVEYFLKEAGFGALLGGIGRGVGSLVGGAARGAGSVIKGLGSGAVGAVKNTASNAMGAIKAAPGQLGQRMTNMGQRVEQRLSGIGQNLAARGANQGAAVQSRLAGPSANPRSLGSTPASATQTPRQQGNDTLNRLSQAHDPQEPVNLPMMSAGQQLAEANPFHGMIDSLRQGAQQVLGGRGAAQYGNFTPGATAPSTASVKPLGVASDPFPSRPGQAPRPLQVPNQPQQPGTVSQIRPRVLSAAA